MKEHMNDAWKNMLAKFEEHPKSKNQTYFQHMGNSMFFSLCSLVSFLVFFTHAVFPFIFTTTGSKIVAHVHRKITGTNAQPIVLSSDNELPPEVISVEDSESGSLEESIGEDGDGSED